MMVKFSAKVVVGQVCSFRSVLNQGTYFLSFLLLDNIGAKALSQFNKAVS